MGKISTQPAVINISGNAATASKLSKSVTINQTPFDGTQNILGKVSYNASSYSNSVKYVVLAKIPNALNKQNRRFGMIVTGGTSFGFSEMPMFYVTAGVYSSYRMDVTLLGKTINDQEVFNSVQFGYYVDDTYMVILMKTFNYANTHTTLVGYSDNSVIVNTMEQIEVGDLPSSFVEVGINRYVAEADITNQWIKYTPTLSTGVRGSVTVSVNKLLNLMIFSGYVNYITSNVEYDDTNLFTLPSELWPKSQMNYNGRFFTFISSEMSTPINVVVSIGSNGLVFQMGGSSIPLNTQCVMHFSDIVFYDFPFKNT